MPHQHSVFHAVLKQVPWDELDQAVERHRAAYCARSFTFKSQVVALLYAQLSGASRPHDVVAGLKSHANRLYRLGAQPASRSSLADANRDRPSAVFSDLLGVMIGRVQRPLRCMMDGAIYLSDSTSLPLNEHSAG